MKRSLEDRYSVYVVAPDRERSAVSMALTLNHPLRVKELAERVYAVDGTTADCVNLAMQKLLPIRPDFVLSGMNIGENLAEDIFFSGTVGGAFSAVLYGIPAMAVSLMSGPGSADELLIDFGQGADLSRRIMEIMLAQADPHVIYNVNIPFPNREIVRVTTLGKKRYTPDVIEREDPRGRNYFWIGTGMPDYIGDEGTDIQTVNRGEISLSPLKYAFSMQAEIDRLRPCFE